MLNIEKLTINAETINTVNSGGWIDDQHREDQQSTFTFAVKRLSPLLIRGRLTPPRHSVSSTGWPLVD